MKGPSRWTPTIAASSDSAFFRHSIDGGERALDLLDRRRHGGRQKGRRSGVRVGSRHGSRRLPRVHDVGSAASVAVKINKARDNQSVRNVGGFFDGADAAVLDHHTPGAEALRREHLAFDACHCESVPGRFTVE